MQFHLYLFLQQTHAFFVKKIQFDGCFPMPRMRKSPRGKDLCSCLRDPKILHNMHKQMESLIVIWKEMLIGWI